MPYSKDGGFVPRTFNDIMNSFLNRVNERLHTTYTMDNFVGTSYYKILYPIAQEVMSTENAFAELNAKTRDYFRTINEEINIPKTPRDGLIRVYKQAGFEVSLEPTTQENAGTIGLCVDLDENADDFAEKKQKVLDMLNVYTVGGMFYNGTTRGNVVLSNGQVMDFGFYLPIKYNVFLQLTIKLSQHTTTLADKEEIVKEKLLANMKERYRLGIDFEPEKYFSLIDDAPYSAAVKLEWKKTEVDGWSRDIYKADFKDLFVFAPERISVIFS